MTGPHHRQLYGIAVALCRDRDQASDLTQEALLRAFKAFDTFRPGAPVLPWLRRILRNLYLDSFKTGRARHELAEHQMAPESAQRRLDVADAGQNPLAQVERGQLAAWLSEELESLQPEHQQVLRLCVMQGLSFKEAAELIDVPVGTVASRLARARAQLRERMVKRTADPDWTARGALTLLLWLSLFSAGQQISWDEAGGFTRSPCTWEAPGSVAVVDRK